MKDIVIAPCTPEQRQKGWDESFEWGSQEWPATWSIRPQTDVYSFGAIHLDVLPVYWDNGDKRGVDWWVQIQKNLTSLDSSVFAPTSADSWRRVNSLQEVKDLTLDWNWNTACYQHAKQKFSSMKVIQDEWCALPFKSPPHAIVPHAHIWVDWGLSHYRPSVLEGKDAENYHTTICHPTLAISLHSLKI